MRRGARLDAAKQPRPALWENPKNLSWLTEHLIICTEFDRAMSTFSNMMDDLYRHAEDNVIPDSNIRLTDKYKMRLYEAFFGGFL